jgi:hypothetical protein
MFREGLELLSDKRHMKVAFHCLTAIPQGP